MNKKHILFGAVALTLGTLSLLPQAAFAYKGNPAVQGPNYTVERHEAMTKAFANNNYSAWKALMNGKGVARKITAENFSQFAKAHELALQGKVAESNAIRTELGLGQHSGSNREQRNCYSSVR